MSDSFIEKIPVVVDGESAYDFRLRINQAIANINTAFEKINEEYNTIIEAVEQYDELKTEIVRAQDSIRTHLETVIKPEINKYFDDFIENSVEDLSTVQIRRNAPMVDSTGYLPDFWYQIESTGPLITSVKLTSPSTILSELSVGEQSDWETNNGTWTILATVKYDDNSIPTINEIVTMKFFLEGGCNIKFDNVSYEGVQYEYNQHDEAISWNLGGLIGWDYLDNGRIGVNNIQVTDGVLTQNFNLVIALSKK